MNELVSVVVPVYNGERFVRETVESVLCQVGVTIDLIVVDDGSTDGTRAVLASLADRLRCVALPHRGQSAARNVGIEHARADWIALVDADDLWLPDKLRCQLDHLLVHPEADGCVTHAVNFFTDGEPTVSHRRIDEPVPGYSLSTLLARRGLFEKVGRFDESGRTSGTIEFFLRARERHARVDLLPDVLVRRRLHDQNISRRQADLARDRLLNAVKGSLDRRRGASPRGSDEL